MITIIHMHPRTGRVEEEEQEEGCPTRSLTPVGEEEEEEIQDGISSDDSSISEASCKVGLH